MSSRAIRDRFHGHSASNANGCMMEEDPSAVGGTATKSKDSPALSSSSAFYAAPPSWQSKDSIDDADVAAGLLQTNLLSHKAPDSHSSVGFAAEPPSRSTSKSSNIMTAPSSLQSLYSINTRPEHHPSDLEFFEDLVSEPVLLLGVDISHLSRQSQFLVCATGVFGFSLLYGYLQELISVELCNRQLGLFLAMMQFSGYTLLAYILRNFVYVRSQRRKAEQASSGSLPLHAASSAYATPAVPPFALYVGLSLLRAIDLGMTNLAMQYINYPAKTLMKSSRVVFTMFFGVLIARKVYKTVDYVIVLGMVAGLGLFMHADANSSAVFDWAGVAMLTVSLLCDGAISNMSETIMNKYGVGQDEFIFRMYSIALVAISVVATAKGDLREGLIFMSQPGSYGPEMSLPVEERTWTVPGKVAVMVLFSSMGFFGSSCSAAITKNFGALTMSITSTARKATTLFLSFFLFNNVCTLEHLVGVFVFISALTAKSLRRGGKKNKKRSSPRQRVFDKHQQQQASRISRRTAHAPHGGIDLETRALLGSDALTGVEGTVLTLEGMEGGTDSCLDTLGTNGTATVSPPSSLGAANSDTPSQKKRLPRQRKPSGSASSPTVTVL